MSTTVFLMIMALTPLEAQPTQNMLIIPMPNMALCKALEDETMQQSEKESVLFFTSCVDISEDASF